jgi:hypothetical protein
LLNHENEPSGAAHRREAATSFDVKPLNHNFKVLNKQIGWKQLGVNRQTNTYRVRQRIEVKLLLAHCALEPPPLKFAQIRRCCP